MFTNTCSEKQETARRIGKEFEYLRPGPPALQCVPGWRRGGNPAQPGADAILHHEWPSVPLLVVVKENSAEFIRMAVRNLADQVPRAPAARDGV